MKKVFILFIVIVLSAVMALTPLYAQSMSGGSANLDPDGNAGDREKLSSITSSTGLTAGKVLKSGIAARAILFSVETAAIRFTIDGSTPTVSSGTAVGHLLNAGDSFIVYGAGNVSRFKCINAVAGNLATVEVTFFY